MDSLGFAQVSGGLTARMAWKYAKAPYTSVSKHGFCRKYQPCCFRAHSQDYEWHSRSSSCSKDKLRCSTLSAPQASIAYDMISMGDVVVDLVVTIEGFPVKSGEHQNLTEPLKMTVGGACNALLVAKRLGMHVGVVDLLGRTDDIFSIFLRQKLDEYGIDTLGLLNVSGKDTPTCVILVDSKTSKHTFVASNERPTAVYRDLDAAEQAKVAKGVPHIFQTMLRSSKLLVMDGYSLDDLPFDIIAGSILHRQQLGLRHFWLDPQSATCHLVKSNPSLMSFMFRHASALFMTEEEAVCVGPEVSTNSPVQLVHAILNQYPNLDLVALKRGPLGAIVADRRGQILECPAFDLRDKYQDSTGAGDSFLAGMAAGQFHFNLDLEKSLLLATASAAATCLQRGCGPNVGTYDQIMHLIEQRDPELAQHLRSLRDMK